MPEPMNLAHFESLLNSRFVLHVDDQRQVDLALFSVQALPAYPGRAGQVSRQQPFSLLFRGPREFILPQKIHSMEHESLGKFEMFLVPIGPDEIGQRYEAIFN